MGLSYLPRSPIARFPACSARCPSVLPRPRPPSSRPGTGPAAGRHHVDIARSRGRDRQARGVVCGMVESQRCDEDGATGPVRGTGSASSSKARRRLRRLAPGALPVDGEAGMTGFDDEVDYAVPASDDARARPHLSAGPTPITTENQQGAARSSGASIWMRISTTTPTTAPASTASSSWHMDLRRRGPGAGVRSAPGVMLLTVPGPGTADHRVSATGYTWGVGLRASPSMGIGTPNETWPLFLDGAAGKLSVCGGAVGPQGTQGSDVVDCAGARRRRKDPLRAPDGHQLAQAQHSASTAIEDEEWQRRSRGLGFVRSAAQLSESKWSD